MDSFRVLQSLYQWVLTGGVIVLALLLLLSLIERAMVSCHDPREPPLIPQFPHLIGHLLGLWRYNFDYAVQLSERISTPIFTLSLPGQKIYVITKPHLIPHLERHSRKSIGSGRFESKICAKVAGVCQATSDITTRNAEEPDGYYHSSSSIFQNALKPGSELDQLSREIVNEIGHFLQAPVPDSSNTGFGLYAWVRGAITSAATNAIYGPGNPFKNPGMQKAFWEYERGIINIYASPAPSLTAPRAVAGREKLVKAFVPYTANLHYTQGSALVQRHISTMREWKTPVEDMARFQILVSTGFLVSTVAVCFSMLVLVHMDDSLLRSIREEVAAVTRIDGSGFKIPLTALKEQCPILTSTWQETLRYRSSGTSIRNVLEDTELDGWLFKKGSVVQVPSRVMHLKQDLWGPDAKTFNSRRFMRTEKPRGRDTAFRAFGGGRKLCHGRHLATNEVLAFVAIFVSKFEMRPADGKEWQMPTAFGTESLSTQMQPDWDVDVEVRPRKGMEDTCWSVEV